MSKLEEIFPFMLPLNNKLASLEDIYNNILPASKYFKFAIGKENKSRIVYGRFPTISRY